jgi:hypothetical protein
VGRDWRDELIDELRAVVARQQAEIEELKKRGAELEERLRTSSHNSSKPPSSDGPSKPKRQRPKRKRGKRNPGGQPGHEKHDRELVPTEQADKLTVVKPEQCERCSKPLVEYNQAPVRHQHVELPPVRPWVHEHPLYAGWCEDCGARPALARDRWGLPEQEGQARVRGQAAKLRGLAPDASPVRQPQMRFLRRRHGAREREGKRLLRLPQRLAALVQKQRAHLSRKRLEDKLVAALNAEILKPEVLEAVYERTAKKIQEQFAHVPEELRLKKLELNRAEARVHNFIEFIAGGRATPGLADALAQAEEQVKTLSADVASMESAKDQAFTPPPRAWIADRVAKLNELLAKRTEKSSLALRRLTDPVTLTPRQPEVGRPYFQAACKVDSLNLLVADGGSNLLRWWSSRESNAAPRRRARGS